MLVPHVEAVEASVRALLCRTVGPTEGMLWSKSLDRDLTKHRDRLRAVARQMSTSGWTPERLLTPGFFARWAPWLMARQGHEPEEFVQRLRVFEEVAPYPARTILALHLAMPPETVVQQFHLSPLGQGAPVGWLAEAIETANRTGLNTSNEPGSMWAATRKWRLIGADGDLTVAVQWLRAVETVRERHPRWVLLEPGAYGQPEKVSRTFERLLDNYGDLDSGWVWAVGGYSPEEARAAVDGVGAGEVPALLARVRMLTALGEE